MIPLSNYRAGPLPLIVRRLLHVIWRQRAEPLKPKPCSQINVRKPEPLTPKPLKPLNPKPYTAYTYIKIGPNGTGVRILQTPTLTKGIPVTSGI